MSGAHAKFSPSGAHRWIHCGGAMLLEKDLPNTSSTYADEGTAAHWLASECLQAGTDAKDHIGKHILVNSRSVFFTPPGVSPGHGGAAAQFEVTDEFAEAVQAYLNDVRDRAKDGHLYIEQRLELVQTLGTPDQFGTSDAVIANAPKRHLTVEDLKFGMGEKVYAEKNEQAMLYGLGVLETLDLIYGDNAFDYLTLVICQPRIDHIDEWTVHIDELRAFGKTAAGAVKRNLRILSGEIPPEFSPAPKTCRWCKAKAHCAALAAAVSEALLNDFNAIDDGTAAAKVMPSQGIASDELIGRRMAMEDLVKDWAKEVRAEGERRVFAGKTILGPDGLPMKIVEGKKGDRAWVDEKQAEAALAGHLPEDKLYVPRKVVTVAKAEAALGKARWKQLTTNADPENGVPAGPLAGLYAQTPGKPSVALGSDRRQPMKSAAAASEFDQPSPAADPLLS